MQQERPLKRVRGKGANISHRGGKEGSQPGNFLEKGRRRGRNRFGRKGKGPALKKIEDLSAGGKQPAAQSFPRTSH